MRGRVACRPMAVARIMASVQSNVCIYIYIYT